MFEQQATLRDWFSEDELDECPRCHQRTAVLSPTGWIICTEWCGIVGVRAQSDSALPER